MHSKNGVTMIGLIIYVVCFLLITGVVGAITSFFYGNSTLMTKELYSSADYNKLNLFFVKESEQKGNRVSNIVLSDNGEVNNKDVDYIVFSNGDKFTFDSNNNLLYYNSVCLCEDVQKFKISTEYTSGKEVLKVNIGFSNKSFTCKYTMLQ